MPLGFSLKVFSVFSFKIYLKMEGLIALVFLLVIPIILVFAFLMIDERRRIKYLTASQNAVGSSVGELIRQLCANVSVKWSETLLSDFMRYQELWSMLRRCSQMKSLSTKSNFKMGWLLPVLLFIVFPAVLIFGFIFIMGGRKMRNLEERIVHAPFGE